MGSLLHAVITEARSVAEHWDTVGQSSDPELFLIEHERRLIRLRRALVNAGYLEVK